MECCKNDIKQNRVSRMEWTAIKYPKRTKIVTLQSVSNNRVKTLWGKKTN